MLTAKTDQAGFMTIFESQLGTQVISLVLSCIVTIDIKFAFNTSKYPLKRNLFFIASC